MVEQSFKMMKAAMMLAVAAATAAMMMEMMVMMVMVVDRGRVAGVLVAAGGCHLHLRSGGV